MVLFHIKRTDTDQFLFETRTTESNDEVIRTLVRSIAGSDAGATPPPLTAARGRSAQVKINNMRVLIQQLCLGCERLVEFGPMKPPEEQGLDEVRNTHIRRPARAAPAAAAPHARALDRPRRLHLAGERESGRGG